MLKAWVHPKIVQERLDHGSIAVTLDTYSHLVSGLQEVAAQSFEGTFDRETLQLLTDLELYKKNVGKNLETDSELHRTRTCNRLIKSAKRNVPPDPSR